MKKFFKLAFYHQKIEKCDKLAKISSDTRNESSESGRFDSLFKGLRREGKENYFKSCAVSDLSKNNTIYPYLTFIYIFFKFKMVVLKPKTTMNK